MLSNKVMSVVDELILDIKDHKKRIIEILEKTQNLQKEFDPDNFDDQKLIDMLTSSFVKYGNVEDDKLS